MDPMVVAAGSALVGAMATDAWQQAHAGLVRLWRRVRPAEADGVGEELSGVRTRVLAARDAGDTASEQELAESWQQRLHQLLDERPASADELRRLLDDTLAPAVREHARAGEASPVVNANSYDTSRLYLSLGDQHFHR